MAATNLTACPPIEELQIRLLAPDEARRHCEVAGPAFDASADLFAQLITPEIFALDEVRGYVGEVDGKPVVTAMSVTLGTGAGIFNVATLEQYRRQGYGAAITTHAVREAMDDGASWAWLQSSEAGYSVYERLGFSTIERWPCWFSPD
jgi:ribosomal protein S18 acetylase RimI-like enzyme